MKNTFERPAEVVRRRWHYLDLVARLQIFACARTRFWLAVEYRLADPNSVDWRSNNHCLGSCGFSKIGGRKRVARIVTVILGAILWLFRRRWLVHILVFAVLLPALPDPRLGKLTTPQTMKCCGRSRTTTIL